VISTASQPVGDCLAVVHSNGIVAVWDIVRRVRLALQLTNGELQLSFVVLCAD
jgi:hypothetical protein